MKKVALMTWSQYHNFGTSLQVTASTYTMRKLGYQVDVVNYLPHAELVTLTDYKKANYYIEKINKKIKGRKNTSVFDKSREDSFVSFLNKNITLTKKCRTDSDLFLLNEEYDAFICGSDQIWAPSIFDSKYFLRFVEESHKMIAYAPSIGLSKIEDPYVKNRMKDNIDRFIHISVREEQGAKLIKEICGKEAKVVLDPTLLLTSNEWDTMAIPVTKEKEYILCYFLGTDKKNWNHVYELSKKTNIPLKIIPVFQLDYERGFETADGVGPGEFLNLVKNALLICTDSFHGTAFSIIYNKPFYTYERFSSKDRNNQNSRIYNILKQLELEDRLINDKKSIPINPLTCDYTEANQLLEKKRMESKYYLENALSQSTNHNKENDYVITNTCCGCGSCSVVCPTNAIEIKRDHKGFLKYFIGKEKCIRCEKCKIVCPFSNKQSQEIQKDLHNLYMIKSVKKDILSTTASGGAGFEIARALSMVGYDVVGCVYDKEKGEAVHKLVRSGDIDSMNEFKGSKYIQSNTKDVFKEVIEMTEKAVIFGTPCQIAGADLLLKSKGTRDNYVLVDLICHGVPTQHLWNKYLKEGSKQYGYGQTPDVKFRDKSKGWREMHMFVEGKGKQYVKIDVKDLFYRYFLLGHCYMESCFECNFRTSTSADIRIGDYWGPRYKEDKEGVSMVITMNATGDTILKNLEATNRVELKKHECSEYWTVKYPQNPVKPVFYDELISDLSDKDKSLDKVADFYCSGFEFNKKLQKPYSILCSMVRRVRNNK